jgi:kynurenine 3-monooxygenase
MRRELQHGERANYSQEYLEWGYKELTLTAAPDGSSLIELTALHVWPRNHCLIVSHPNRDNSHTLTLFLPFEGEDSFATTRTPADVEAFIAKYFPDLAPSLPALLEQWMKHPVGSLITTRTTPWAFGDWAVLVGDACHAVYPFYGQGMNSAFEDCCVLLSSLAEHQEDNASAFVPLSARREHTDVLCVSCPKRTSRIEKESSVAVVRGSQTIDLVLNRLPEARAAVTMIAHTTIPYGVALERARRQERILVGSAVGVFAAISFVIAMVVSRHG